MSGWNIFYGLINFAILAGVLWLLGRKSAVKIFRGHREQVTRDLAASEAAAQNSGRV